MTPSVWLLQHEYEYHGTCMHDESLEDPDTYFSKAAEIDEKINMPKEQLPYTEKSLAWFKEHNKGLRRESIQYWKKEHEWQFCIDNNFNFMDCPSSSENSINHSDDDVAKCPIKGNISENSGNKYYFTPNHPNYRSVKIHPRKGEMCFVSEDEARKAGWIKAP